MSELTQVIIDFLTNFAHSVPLPLFAAIGAIAEELIAIIPSPFMPLTAGSIALSQHRPVSYLFLIAIVGAIAKTAASSLVYWLADKLEDWIAQGKVGKFLGLEDDDIERYSQMFRQGKKNAWLLLLLRALPFVPTLPVTIVSGLIKIKFKVFVIYGLIGLFIRNVFYLLVAYFGLQRFQGLLSSINTVNLVLEVTVILSVLGFLFMLFRKNWDSWLQALKLKKSQKKSKSKKTAK